MIRDPSDGSVREKPNLDRQIVDGDLPQASGLPLASTKSKDLAKLEKSREWLKDYFQRKPEQGT